MFQITIDRYSVHRSSPMYQNLVNVLRKLRKPGFEANITIVGDGPFRSTIEKYLAPAELKSNVTLTGRFDAGRICQILRESRTMILPSFMEVLPVSIMEALCSYGR